MVDPEKFYDALRVEGVDLFTGVPDSLLKDFCAYVTDHSDSNHNIVAANEGTAIGIAAGHYLATSRIPLVYLQNSGIGNATNPLLSLVDDKVYSIPMILVIGWRGEPCVHDEPQHIRQGEVTIPLLEAMKIPYTILPEDDEEAITIVGKILTDCKNISKPHAIVIRKGTFSKYNLQKEATNEYPLSREEALKLVVANMGETCVSVSTTGKLSRELFELRESRGEGHDRDFLTVGSMGHSSSIALGIALEKPDNKVWCLDGDGAFIMHMGALTNIGNLKPINFVHVLFNNGAHESVGGQTTLGLDIDVISIVKACGYRNVYSVNMPEDIVATTNLAKIQEGPTFIEIKVHINSRDNLGRPTTTPIENKKALMSFLNNCYASRNYRGN